MTKTNRNTSMTFLSARVELLRPSRAVFNGRKGPDQAPAATPPEGTRLTEGAEKPKVLPMQVNQMAANYKFHHRNLASRTEQLSKSDRERMRDIGNKYRQRLDEVVDPKTFDALKPDAQKTNLDSIISIAQKFNKEVQLAAVGKRPQETQPRESGTPEWLSSAVLDAPRKAFQQEYEKAVTKLNDIKTNKYTNARTDAGQYFMQIRAGIDDLNARVKTAKTADEIAKLTNNVKNLASDKAIDTALKQDWANSLINYSVARAMETTKPNEDPTALLSRIQTNLRQFTRQEPFLSLPPGGVYAVNNNGIDIQIKNTGARVYTASINGIDTYAVNRYPRIARYVEEAKEKKTRAA